MDLINSKPGHVWSGVLRSPCILETDDGNWGTKIIGFPRNIRILLQVDHELPGFETDRDAQEVGAIISHLERKGL